MEVCITLEKKAVDPYEQVLRKTGGTKAKAGERHTTCAEGGLAAGATEGGPCATVAVDAAAQLIRTGRLCGWAADAGNRCESKKTNRQPVASTLAEVRGNGAPPPQTPPPPKHK